MKKKGFTLVELMIAISIFALLSMFMYRFFADEQKSLIAKNRQLDMYYNGAMAINYIKGMARRNPDLYYDAASGSFVTDGAVSMAVFDPDGSPGSAQLYLDKSSRALKDSDGNTLCTYIDSINITLQGTDEELMNISIKLSYGTGVSERDYVVNSTVNLEK